MSRDAHVVGWSDSLELTIATPGGESVVLDIPSLLHDAGLLSKITRVDGDVPLRVSHSTGKYIGVEKNAQGGYVAYGRSRVESTSARDAAYKRIVAFRTALVTRPRETEEASVVVKRRRIDHGVIQHWEDGKYVRTTFAEGLKWHGEIMHFEDGKYVRTTFAEGVRSTHADDKEECVFVKERTREQRDAEGRANAIVVD